MEEWSSGEVVERSRSFRVSGIRAEGVGVLLERICLACGGVFSVVDPVFGLE